MIRTLASLILTGVLALTCSITPALAQTGPVGQPSAPAVAPQGQAQFIKLDKNTLPQMLQQAGFTVQTRNDIFQISATKDGWSYVVDVVPVHNNGAMVGFLLRSELGNPIADNGANSLLQALLQHNQSQPFYYFSFNAQSHKVVLNWQFPMGDSTPQELQGVVNNFFAKIRDTYPVWGNSAQPANNTPASNPAAPSMPVPPQSPAMPSFQVPPQAPAAANNLANTKWSGQEDIQKGQMSPIAFQFLPGGNVMMIVPDHNGTYQGTYVQNGNQVTMNFPAAQNVYQGVINGQTFTGKASDHKGGSWNFSVSVQN